MSPVRIGFVDHASGVGGAQRSLLELLGRLDRVRFEPVLFCARDATWTGAEELRDVEIVPAFSSAAVLRQRRDDLAGSLVASRRLVRGSLGPVCDLWRQLRRARVRLVHTNTLKAHLIGTAAARLAGLPLVWHVRDILEPGGARSWLLRAARIGHPTIIAISQAVADQFAGAGLQPRVIHNGIPLEAFTPGEPDPALRDALGLQPQHQVIAIVGRLTPWKGHRTLLQALARLAPERPDLRLMVVGEVSFWEPGYLDELHALAEDLGVHDRVLWLGFRADVAALLRLSDILVLPSVDEPFGRAIIEAMAVARPVVATRSGGVPEIIEEWRTGLLVPPGQAPPLADALAALLDDPDAAQRMGEEGCRRARALFDARRVVAAVEGLYDELLAPRRLRAHP